MIVILIFAGLAIAGNVFNVAVAMMIERQFSEYTALLVFLGLFAANFVVAWQIAIRLAERLTPSEPVEPRRVVATVQR